MADIFQGHQKVLQFFDAKKEEQVNLLQRIHSLELLRDNLVKNKDALSIHKVIILKEIESQIKMMFEIIQEYIHLDKDIYLVQITPLLARYKEILSRPIKINFMGKKTTEDSTEKDTLEEQINTILHPYIFIQGAKTDTICKTCNVLLEWVDRNKVLCIQCGKEENRIQMTFSVTDIERINLNSKYIYERTVHFLDSIKQLQGKQNCTIQKHVYEKILEKIKAYNMSINKVTKNDILLFLKEESFTNHYENVNLIYHNITKKPLMDISHLEEKLVEDFNILSELFNQIFIEERKIDRSSFLNTHYVLYQLLRRHKFPCDKKDFHMLKTVDRLKQTDIYCQELFAILNWNFSQIF